MEENDRKQLGDFPDEPGRRTFLKTGIGAVGGTLLLGPSLFSGCASSRLPIVKRPCQTKYNTIAHEILDIELEHDDSAINYLRLDSIIDVATKIVLSAMENAESPRDNALIALATIDALLDNYGFKYEKVRLLNYGLRAKRINCDCYSALYLAIGEQLNLPIKMVRAPQHTFVRWHLNEEEYINWETTNGLVKEDNYYILRHNISRKSKGVCSMRSLDVIEDREKILANAFVNSGAEWLKKCRPRIAITRYDEAIRRDPHFETPYYNIGLIHYREGQMKKAIRWCGKVLKLNPNHTKSHAILESAYNEIDKEVKAKKHLEKLMELDPDYYTAKAMKTRLKNNICRGKPRMEFTRRI